MELRILHGKALHVEQSYSHQPDSYQHWLGNVERMDGYSKAMAEARRILCRKNDGRDTLSRMAARSSRAPFQEPYLYRLRGRQRTSGSSLTAFPHSAGA